MFKKQNSRAHVLNSPALPKKFFIFINSDIYKNNKLRVKINQKVLRGQPLIFGSNSIVPIHSPTSGLIEEISYYSTSIYTNKKNIKIVILSDFLDKWIRLKPIKNYEKYTPKTLIQIIHQSGVVGLGGGQFSSAKKLILSADKVHTLIVNGVESEPYITADNFLINNYASEILIGCKIISWISKIKVVLIAIQEDKVESISKINNLVKDQSLFKICIVKKKYPGGSSKVLIKSLTGKEIPYQKHSIDMGYIIFNVATIYAIKRAIINGEPLTERIITFLGNKNNLSGNFWTRIGTPVKHFVADKTDIKYLNIEIYLGGPFMGKAIFNFDYAILKNINCIFIQSKKKIRNHLLEKSCIRCGYCSQVCPVNLLPQQLYWYSKNGNHEETKKHHILDCIECKACEKICPSYIPLVKYFKNEKKIQKNIYLENNRKKISLFRFKIREKRLLNQKNIINKNSIDYKYFNVIDKNKINLSTIEDAYKNDFLDQKNIEKNIRKEIIRKALDRIKLKNKSL